MSSPPSNKASPKVVSPGRSEGETNILPPEHFAQLVAEQGEDEEFDDSASSTASLTSSILAYRKIHGRTYHSERGDAKYWGSIDGGQSEALDINHHVLNLLLGEKLYLAPLSKDIQTVVDIGTGTGIWATDFADQFPNCSVIGTDIAPIQPSWVPPNVEFQIDDCTREWTFKENSLDYIHIRWLVGSIADWPALFKQAYRCLKPGGYLESYEPSSGFESDDGSVTETSALFQWGKFFVGGGESIGRSFTIFEDESQIEAMEEAGFTNIETRDFKNPVGTWPQDAKLKDIGLYSQAMFEHDPEGSVLFMASQLGWTRDEVAVYLVQLRREFRSRRTHPFFRQRVVWGQKPALS